MVPAEKNVYNNEEPNRWWRLKFDLLTPIWSENKLIQLTKGEFSLHKIQLPFVPEREWLR